MKCRSVRGMPGKAVAVEVVRDSGKDLLVVGLSFLLILVLGRFWPPVGAWGRWVMVVAAAVLTLQFFTSCLINLGDSVMDGIKGVEVEGSGWLVLSMAIRLAELVAVYWMMMVLFRRFG